MKYSKKGTRVTRFVEGNKNLTQKEDIIKGQKVTQWGAGERGETFFSLIFNRCVFAGVSKTHGALPTSSSQPSVSEGKNENFLKSKCTIRNCGKRQVAKVLGRGCETGMG